MNKNIAMLGIWLRPNFACLFYLFLFQLLIATEKGKQAFSLDQVVGLLETVISDILAFAGRCLQNFGLFNGPLRVGHAAINCLFWGLCALAIYPQNTLSPPKYY